MVEATVSLNEIRLEEGQRGGRISRPPALLPAPGQYLLGRPADERVAFASTLFPSKIIDAEIEISPPLPASWTVGMSLSLVGPLGNGFHLPGSARRVALASFWGGMDRLLPLAQLALAQGADVVLFTDALPVGLARAVEVQPSRQLPSALQWADYLAVDIPVRDLTQLGSWLGLPFDRHCPCQAEVLVWGDFLCGGLASCGVCAIHTRQGWKLACKDGPVFDLNFLELE